MKAFFEKYGSRIGTAGTALLLAGSVFAAGFLAWRSSLPKFQDVTIELGQPLPEASAFLTQYGDPAEASFVTGSAELDLTKPGSQQVKLIHDVTCETVTLHIVDTTAPTLTLKDLVRDIQYAPVPEDFVAESFDLSEITFSFAQPIPTPENYGSTTVEVVATDASGNSTTVAATLSYVWMKDAFTLEYGDTLEKSDLLMNPEKDAGLLDQARIDEINAGGVGEYTVTSSDQGQTCVCKVTVADTTPPTLELRDVEVYVRSPKVKLEDFLVASQDISGEVTVRLLTEPEMDKVSVQVIQVEAKDIYGNTTVGEAKLNVIADTVSPKFSGVGPLSVEKHSTPDYSKGVSAHDDRDGEVSFSYDASRVDTSKAGTYYVTYTARDLSGNTGTYRRKVVVNHDAEDTAALVASVAQKCGSGVEEIRNYVRSSIGYSTNWGGDDPVWYGFKNKSGNCYVHALCLKAILDYRGYSTRLIWVTDKSHYWVMVDMGGYWRHVDATPGSRHSKYSLMTDEQRFETLQAGIPGGRDWDRDKWPTAN